MDLKDKMRAVELISGLKNALSELTSIVMGSTVEPAQAKEQGEFKLEEYVDSRALGGDEVYICSRCQKTTAGMIYDVQGTAVCTDCRGYMPQWNENSSVYFDHKVKKRLIYRMTDGEGNSFLSDEHTKLGWWYTPEQCSDLEYRGELLKCFSY